MNDLMPYEGSMGLSRDSRRASRSISRGRSVTQVRQARVADEAEVAIEKVEQVSYATVYAMSACGRVNAAQKTLEEQAPELAGRLSRLADFHELALVQCVEDLRRDLRRR